jgi:hypothetical protein
MAGRLTLIWRARVTPERLQRNPGRNSNRARAHAKKVSA